MLRESLIQSALVGSVCVSTRDVSQFPSVLLHPPPLAGDFVASYGEMSRRSGAAATEPDISNRYEPDALKAGA
jgi:hypothetical protein